MLQTGPPARCLPFLDRALRYGLAGVVNGVVSIALTAALDLGLHVRPALANAAGYAVGVAISFTLARTFVFRDQGKVRTTGPRYLAVIAMAFLLNQLVLATMLHLMGPNPMDHVFAQLSGMVTYTAFSFMACHLWVFRPPSQVS